MTSKHPLMRRHGDVGKRKHVTLVISYKLTVVRNLKVVKAAPFLWQCTRVDHQPCGHMSVGLNEFAVFSSGTSYKTLKSLCLFLKHGTLML